MNLTGKVHEISDTIVVSDKFKKRELIIEYAENANYPEYIKVEAHQDKTNLFDSLNVGDQAEVEFNLRGKPFTNKSGVTSYFNSLVAWKVKVISKASDASPAYAAPADISSASDLDDLPF